MYIGSSANVAQRMYVHRNKLRRGLHENPRLQNSWCKHGESKFIFEPLIECSADVLRQREQMFLDAYTEHGLVLYNMQGSEVGFKFKRAHTPETKEKIRLGNLGKTISQETRDRIRKVMTGRKLSVDHRNKIGKAQRGRKMSEYTRQRLLEAHIGKPMPLHVREALRLGKERHKVVVCTCG